MTNSKAEVSIRPMREADLAEVDRIFRTAFGTFLGLPDPMAFTGDSDFVATRWRADPSFAFVAERAGSVVGSVFAAHWGSFGFFGPLTVVPELWDQGVGRKLLEPVMDLFDRWQVRLGGLFTFAGSPKHVAFYQKLGFWPRLLTALVSRPIEGNMAIPEMVAYSKIGSERHVWLAQCREVTEAIYPGLDVTLEVKSVFRQNLGDTVLLMRDGRLEALAVCHVGAKTEAGSGVCYVKFAAVRPGPAEAEIFDQLLNASAGVGASRGATQVLAGINTARVAAYQHLLEKGFRIEMLGVAMLRSTDGIDDPGWSRPEVFALDDWR